MAASKQDIRNWFNLGVRGGATHMLVVCDKFDYDDYPVYVAVKDLVVSDFDSVDDAIAYYEKDSMQEIQEVYDLSEDREQQLAQFSTWSV